MRGISSVAHLTAYPSTRYRLSLTLPLSLSPSALTQTPQSIHPTIPTVQDIPVVHTVKDNPSVWKATINGAMESSNPVPVCAPCQDFYPLRSLSKSWRRSWTPARRQACYVPVPSYVAPGTAIARRSCTGASQSLPIPSSSDSLPQLVNFQRCESDSLKRSVSSFETLRRHFLSSLEGTCFFFALSQLASVTALTLYGLELCDFSELRSIPSKFPLLTNLSISYITLKRFPVDLGLILPDVVRAAASPGQALRAQLQSLQLTSLCATILYLLVGWLTSCDATCRSVSKLWIAPHGPMEGVHRIQQLLRITGTSLTHCQLELRLEGEHKVPAHRRTEMTYLVVGSHTRPPSQS